MKRNLDKDFARFIENHPAIIRALTHDSSLPLEAQWNFLLYIFDLNYFSLNETEDGIRFQAEYEAERDLQNPLPPPEALTKLMQLAYAANKAESTQEEKPLENGRYFVEAATAIPLAITGERKILLLCKQLEMSKADKERNYVFNGYELQRYLPIIQNFVRADEQQRQILSSKEKINEQQRQILSNNRKIDEQQSLILSAKKKINMGKLVAIGSGVFGSLQAWQAVKDLFGGFKLMEIIQGVGMIVFLIFAVVVAIRLSREEDSR